MRKYNFIYEKLVKDENDLVGLIAYSLYKRKKIAYIKSFKEKDKNYEMSEEELNSFHNASQLHTSDYKYQANTLIQDFTNHLLETETQEIEADYEERFREELKSLKNKWWEGAFHGIVGNLGFSLVLGAIILILIGVNSGIGAVYKRFENMITATSIEQTSAPKSTIP